MTDEKSQIGHPFEDVNNKGAPISIQWDKENGKDWIILKDQDGEEIMRVQKILWRSKDIGFTPEIRDSIMEEAQKLFG